MTERSSLFNARLRRLDRRLDRIAAVERADDPEWNEDIIVAYGWLRWMVPGGEVLERFDAFVDSLLDALEEHRG